MAVEEHGAGRQLVRFRSWPRPERFAVIVFLVLAAGAVDCAMVHDAAATAFLAASAAVLTFQMVQQCGAAMMAVHRALFQVGAGKVPEAQPAKHKRETKRQHSTIPLEFRPEAAARRAAAGGGED
jgi:hypothetical protein